MAMKSPITLAGGIKASRAPFSPPPPVCSAAFAAFTVLSQALAEAQAAEELRADPASWDLAMDDLDAAAEDAINNAVAAARAAGDAPVALASDRRLVFAARFIHCALGIESAPDRVNITHFFGASSGLWASETCGLTAKRVNALVEVTVARLLSLIDLMAEAPDGHATDFV